MNNQTECLVGHKNQRKCLFCFWPAQLGLLIYYLFMINILFLHTRMPLPTTSLELYLGNFEVNKKEHYVLLVQ